MAEFENKIKAALLSLGRIGGPGGEATAEHGTYGYWHRNDHLPEVSCRPGVALAQRTVAPPAYQRVRPVDSGELAGTEYFTYYMLTDPLETILEMFAGGSRALRDAGRMRSLPVPSSGGIYRLVGAYASERVVVSANAVPYLPHKGVFVSVIDTPEGADREALHGYYDEVHIPDLLSVKHVTGCYWFQSWPEAPVTGVALPPANRNVRILFLDGDPIEMVRDLHWRAAQWRAAGRTHPDADAATRLLAGPFQLVSGEHYDWFD
ncbi:hypothetical protein MK489_04615 [Myxococcota bacterium]|nr:hypothetical protein [Myxococcota bacterium]